MEDKKFQPYVPADKVMPEFTAVSILLGALLAIIFGGANAYLGLRVGMTVSASIPAAVISMGVIRKVLRRDSILENNMVQTIGSAGESVAAGAIFTLPALFMWAKEGLCDTPSMITIGLIALCVAVSSLGIGSIRGILANTPDVNEVDIMPLGYATFLYDCNGNQIRKLRHRQPAVSLHHLPLNQRHGGIASAEAEQADLEKA